ncbi:MAG: FKBP-type peptidyl-prolyl cis-trans isomerase [Cyclobacteriaceae bacterium]
MKRSLTYFTSLLMAITGLAGCLDQEDSAYEQRIQEENQLIEDYLENNQIETERLTSGVHFEVLRENNSGSAVDDESIVAIYYSLRTLEGKAIDSVDSNALPVRFFHAQNAPNALFPRGINIGVGHMREGEQYRFYIPSYQAFESYSFNQLLPKEAILVADVEVDKIESEDEIRESNQQDIMAYAETKSLTGVQELPSGIFFQSLEEGTGSSPKSNNQVKVSYKGYYLDEEVFDESEDNKPIEFVIGRNSVIFGFEQGILQMKKGEKARIFIPSHLGFEGGVQVIPEAIREDFLEEYNIRNWRPYESVVFDVELIDIQ